MEDGQRKQKTASKEQRKQRALQFAMNRLSSFDAHEAEAKADSKQKIASFLEDSDRHDHDIHQKVNICPTVEHLCKVSSRNLAHLRAVDLSNTNIKTIGQAFSCNDILVSVKFPSSLKSIGQRAFFECENLSRISFPTKNSSIVSIEAQAFYGCGITTLTFPTSLQSIADEAFGYCVKLSSVFIPRTVKVHRNAFTGCNELPSFMVRTVSHNRHKEYSFCNFEEDTTEILQLEEEEIAEFSYRSNEIMRHAILLDGLKHINNGAFENCISLEKVELPQSVTYVGDFVFKGCSSLIDINIPERTTWISRELFSDCVLLRHIVLSHQTMYICESGFENCKSLKDIYIPETVVGIQKKAFKDCTSLKYMALPSSLTTCGDALFEGCTSLEKVEFGKDIQISSIEQRAFYNCNALKECKLPGKITLIKSEAFFNCKSLHSIEFHEGITAIDDFAFRGCRSIVDIHFPRSLKSIGVKAFRDCTSLRSVKFFSLDDIEIGRKAFQNCESLACIEGLSNDDDETIKHLLNEKVFSGCRSLETTVGNEIHLVAEGKCWQRGHFPQDSHLWIEQAIKEVNEGRNSTDATFDKDHNGDTAFQCAVRGGAPVEYLKILASGMDERGRTHFDNFAENFAKMKAEDFNSEELAFRIDENSRLLAHTPIGEGKRYLSSFEMLLGSNNFDPRTVPEFIEHLNEQFEKRRFVAVIMLDLLMPIIRAWAFSYLTYETWKGLPDMWAFALVYISLIYLSLRELLQFMGGKIAYLTNIWNYIDISVMSFVFISTYGMQTINRDYWMKQSEEYKHDSFIFWTNSFAITTFLVWMYAVLKLRVLSLQFAVFVSGIINIIYTLVPFLVVSVLILGAFGQMYLVIGTRDFPTFEEALWHTYSEFLAFSGLVDATSREDKIITGVFGFLVVVLLLNIVIAVASTAWTGVTERGRDDFLLYRIKLFLELRDIFKWMEVHRPESLKKHRSLTPDNNHDLVWRDSKDFADVLRRTSLKKEGFTLVARILLSVLYLILGFFFGITWPRSIRKRFFFIDNTSAISEKHNRLHKLLKETEKELEKQEKIDRHITENPKDEKMLLIECSGVSTHLELKKSIRTLKKRVEKHKRDFANFRKWQINKSKNVTKCF